MHAGNIFSALMCWLIVRLQDGRIVLRIEDLDAERSRAAYAERVPYDLELLGLTWDEGPYYQSTEKERYRAVIDDLTHRDLVYPCYCTRADLHAASAPHSGDAYCYPGTCRDLTPDERAARLALRRAGFSRSEEAEAYRPALRLRCDDRTISFDDLFQGEFSRRLDDECGDFVIARSNGGASYQLAVIVDDAAQGVNCVVRGCDLLPVTPQQIYLQELLGYETPAYAHIPLLVDHEGVRLAKRHKSASLEQMLAKFASPADVMGFIAATTGLIDEEEPIMPADLLKRLTLDDLVRKFEGKRSIPFPSL